MSNPRSFIIQNVPPTTNFFLFEDKTFPFNINLFNCHTDYFISKNIQVNPNSTINLLDKEDEYISITHDSIKTFINFCHGKDINIDNDNVISIYRLAQKYMVKNLIEFSTKYITEHRDEIVIPFIIMNHQHADPVVESFEQNISDNLEYYITDDKLLMLPIPSLHRILTKYKLKTQNQIGEPIIEFLLKYYTKHGRSSSVLFENIDLYNEHNSFLVQLLNDDKYSDFDFHFITTEFNKSVYNLHREIIQNENLIKVRLDELKQENNQLKLQLQQQSDDFNQKIDNLNNLINQLSETIRQQRNEIDELKKPHINRPFVSEQYPKGIIAYLNGLVNISAGGNHDYNHPLNNIRNYDNSYFYNYCSSHVSSAEKSYIEFDVGLLHKIDLNSYFIQSNCNNANTDRHPKSWKIKGSNDRENWIDLDLRENDSNLNGPYKKCHFICNQGKYGNPNSRFRYIRYYQDASWYSDHTYSIYITYFELYGDIYTI